MNLNHLGIFYAVAGEGSISRGAERLHISQPAVSKQLAEFERTLGIPLFDRLPKGVRLTEPGVLLQGYAHRLFALEAEAETVVRELRGLERGRVAIGASTSIGAYLLPSVFVAFHRAFPKIEIQLEISNTETIQKAVESGTFDIGFTEGLVHSNRLEAEVFLEDDLVPICAPHYPSLLQTDTPRTLAQLCTEPFLLREPGSGTREIIEQAFSQQGLNIRPIMTLGSTEAIKRAVAEGVGVAVVSRLTIQTEEREGHLVVPSVADFVLRRPLHQVQVHGHHRTAAVQAFLRVFRSTLATQAARLGSQ